MSDDILISDLVEYVKAQLLHAQAADSRKIFKLEEVTINTKVVAKKKTKGDGKLTLYVLTVGAESAGEIESSHEITIKLKPSQDNNEQFFMGDSDE